jgi:hypothetical protein
VQHRLLAASLAVLGIGLLLFAGCARGRGFAECPVSPCQDYLTSEEIDQMPILERPDRPGHILGNAIRRIYRGQTDQGDPWECP